MKKVKRDNIIVPYSLHDMNICAIEREGDKISLRTQSGIIKVDGLSEQVDGHVELNGLDFDFCHVWLMSTRIGYGEFSGRSMNLLDFIEEFPQFGFSVIDEVYGYNQTKYWGYLSSKRQTWECIIEFYHLGDMYFVEE